MTTWQIDEATRRQAIDALDLVRLRDDGALQAITDFASALCDTTTALITIVEDERQQFLVRTGFAACETPREQSFCAHAMIGREIMVVPDARRDPRFGDNPLVRDGPQIRFYAGAPLTDSNGVPLGAVCVIDSAPRKQLSRLQTQGLTVLADAVMAAFNASRVAA